MMRPTRQKLDAGGSTDCGPARPANQDAFLCRPELAAFAVADGLGGHVHGELAAQLAIGSLSAFLAATQDRSCEILTQALDTARDAIRRHERGGDLAASSSR